MANNNVHPYYCGIDLHARSFYVYIIDQVGNTCLHNSNDKAGHVAQTCFGETAKDHMHFEGEASGRQMVFQIPTLSVMPFLVLLLLYIEQFKGSFLNQYGHRLLPSQRKTLADMKVCRNRYSPLMQALCATCPVTKPILRAPKTMFWSAI